MPEQDQGFSAEKLTDVLGLLGGGALTKSILVGPGALRALGGAKSMHPAVAKNIGWGGSLKHPLALKTQRALDEDVMQNFEKYKQLPQSEWGNLHKNTGWDFGQEMGLAREIPDVGINWHGLKYPEFPDHPAGDVQKVFNLAPIRWQDNPQIASYGRSFSGGNQIGMDPALRGYAKDLPGYIYKHYPPNYPLRMKANESLAHELQHASQEEAGSNPLNKVFNMRNVPYSQRPWENEATGVGFRAMHPESYLYPFHQMQTTDYDQFSDILNQLKQK